MKKTTSHKPKQKTARPSGSAELLLEIGTEELPYEMIAPALALLKDHAEGLLSEARLSSISIQTYGTPRRLVLVIEGLATHQAPMVKEAMGPSKAVAFDQAGQPTRAAIGFATGQGVPVESLQVRPTPKGEYLFAVKQDTGRPSQAVLLDLLPQLVGKLSFPKSMKWNDAGVRFARPVRWLVALFAGRVLPVEVAGIKAGNRTYGHRVMGGGKPLTVHDFKTYNQGLERHGVLVDPERRRVAIQEQLDRLCTEAGVGLNADESLLDQAVYTTEWPYAIVGNFKSEYLSVPSEILMTSMKEHQGFFSVRDRKSGKLAAHFIAVANNQLKDMSLIRAGNERVLAARLADAKFFFDEDRKVKLEARAKKLGGVTFHQKLGTMAQKQERVTKLTVAIAEQLGLSEHLIKCCRRSAELCKADLLSGIVGEFPTLQGIMGGCYAKHDEEDPEVATAISQHYLPRAMEGNIPSGRVSQVLSVADRLDSIAAFFRVGIIPSGSEDPFALRRHATAIVRIILEAPLRLDLGRVIDQAMAVVAGCGFKAVPETDSHQRIVDFFFERVRHYGKTVHSFRDDVMNAVLNAADRKSFDLVDLLAKMSALQAVTLERDFEPLIIGFKRAHRLTEKEQWDKKPVESALFQNPAESELHLMLNRLRQRMVDRMKAGKYDESLHSLVALKPAIDAFFAAVMVNAEDKAIRSNRLSLLKEVDDFFMSFADFSQIMVQGS